MPDAGCFGTEVKMEKRQRDILPDVLKGFGIVLMVLGHCIQSGSGMAYLEGACYFEDRWYQFLYSFHMPLFMVISGWYAWGSVRRAESREARRAMIRRKCVYLITPNVAWKLIEFAYMSAAGIYLYSGFGVLCKDIFIGILTSNWFLWAILYSFLLVCLMHYKLGDSVWIYVLIFLAAFFTPDGMGLNAYKYMLPYYLIGFYGNMNRERLLSLKVCRKFYEKSRLMAFLAPVVSGVLFFALFSFFTEDSFIYLTGYKLIGKNYPVQLRIDLYRFFVGFAGIVFWALVWGLALRCRKESKVVRVFVWLGRRSLGIYLVSGMLIVHAMLPVTASFAPHYGINVLETVIMLALSAGLVEGLRRVKWLCRLVGEERSEGLYEK